VSGVTRDDEDPHAFLIEWSTLYAGHNPWKATNKVAIDPLLVAKAVKEVMKRCPHHTASGRPLVWNEYAVFMDLTDWERIKKLEATLVRDLGDVVQKELLRLKAEMVGMLNVRLLRDEGGSVRPGRAVIKVDFAEGEPLQAPDPGEMTIRVGAPALRSLTELPTERVPELMTGQDRLRLLWPGGSTRVSDGVRTLLGRPHTGAPSHFVALSGASSKINKKQLWIEATDGGAIIGRLSDANPVQVKGRLVQAGGQISIDELPAEISLSSGELVLTLERMPTALSLPEA
jgi:Protein of unknown function (DUF3662)